MLDLFYEVLGRHGRNQLPLQRQVHPRSQLSRLCRQTVLIRFNILLLKDLLSMFSDRQISLLTGTESLGDDRREDNLEHASAVAHSK